MKRLVRMTLILMFGLLMVPKVARAQALDSRGTDFWLAFPSNLGPPQLTLFIAGETATTGTVTVPGIAFSAAFTVTPGSVTAVPLPTTAQQSTADGVESLGIHVTAISEVTVYGLSRVQFTTDAYLGLPTDILGTDYIVLGFANTTVWKGTEFGIAATKDGTIVTITPSVTTGPRTAGVPYTVSLNAGQTYQLRNTTSLPGDLSGTIVTSNFPIAVFGGQQCANIPDGSTVACDHVVEEIPPTTTWGRSFVTMPLATRTRGDTFRVLAQTNGTQVSVNGAPVGTLNRGQFLQQIITGPAQITATQPVLVAQYSNGSSFDGVTSDPFMMLIPPQEQFLPAYTVTTPATGFAINYINLVVPSPGVGSTKVDGVIIPSASFTAIGSSGFAGAQVNVGLGSHRLEGALPFGAFVYGFDSFDSYGYPGGMSLAPVAVVTTLSLSPKTATNPTGTLDCVTATVLDQSAHPVVGVRVDFTVTGPNAQLGFGNAAADGTSKFCYSGATAGTDTIKASVSTISDAATKTWTTVAPPATTPPSCALTAVIAGPPKKLQITVQDADNGLKSVEVTESNNTTVVVPAFTPGEKQAVVIDATKINQSSGSQVALRVTDVNGAVTVCDPVVPGQANDAPSSSGEGGGLACSVGRNVSGSELLATTLIGLVLLFRRRSSSRKTP